MRKSTIAVLVAMLALSTAAVFGAGSYAQFIFLNTGLKILNPLHTHTVQITPGAQTANAVLNIPVLGSSDTLVTAGAAVTRTGATTFGTGGTAVSFLKAANVALSSGTATVADSTVTANTVIVVTSSDTTGETFKVVVTPSTNFVITSSNVASTAHVNYLRIN